MILIITRLTINGVIMIACHQITQIARSLHQVVIRWCSRVQRRWQRWSHWILANKKSDARQEKKSSLAVEEEWLLAPSWIPRSTRMRTRNDKYLKSSVNLQLIIVLLCQKDERRIKKRPGAPNDQPGVHQMLSQDLNLLIRSPWWFSIWGGGCPHPQCPSPQNLNASSTRRAAT